MLNKADNVGELFELANAQIKADGQLVLVSSLAAEISKILTGGQELLSKENT